MYKILPNSGSPWIILYDLTFKMRKHYNAECYKKGDNHSYFYVFFSPKVAFIYL